MLKFLCLWTTVIVTQESSSWVTRLGPTHHTVIWQLVWAPKSELEWLRAAVAEQLSYLCQRRAADGILAQHLCREAIGGLQLSLREMRLSPIFDAVDNLLIEPAGQAKLDVVEPDIIAIVVARRDQNDELGNARLEHGPPS